jgi:TonB-dependent receptor
MKQLPRKKQLVIACAHALAVMFTSQAFAAEEDTSATAVEVKSDEDSQKLSSERKREQEIERIEVTGYAGSVEKSLASKRYANGVVDSIIAEDIGKMPDSNVAEALQRMAGISINRDGGEGTTISIRGMSPDMNQVSVNGQTVGGTGTWDPESDPNDSGGGGVNFSSMAADMLSQIEVIKTPSANTVEGSIGGRVNLRTRLPLDGKRRQFSARIRQSYNELSENMDPTFGMNFSDQFFDRKFGLSFGASSERRRGRTDKVDTGGWHKYDDITHNTDGYEYLKTASSEDSTQPDNSGPLYMRDTLSNIVYDKDFNDVSDSVNTASLVAAPQIGHAMAQTQFYYEEKDQTRNNANITLQYQPTDEFSTHIDLGYNRLEELKTRARFILNYDEIGFLQEHNLGREAYDEDVTLADVTRGVNGVFSGMDIDEHGTVVKARNIRGRVDNRADSTSLINETFVGNLGFEYETDSWLTSGRVGYSKTTEETDGYNSLRAHNSSQIIGYDVGPDFQRPEYVWPRHDNDADELGVHPVAHDPNVNDRNVYGNLTGDDGYNYLTADNEHATIRQVKSDFREFENEQVSAQLDTEYMFDDSDHFTSVMFGVMYTNNKKHSLGHSLETDAQFTGVPLLMDEPGSIVQFVGDNYLGGQVASGIANQGPVTTWATPNFNSINRRFLEMYNTWYADPANDLRDNHPPITDISQAYGYIDPSSTNGVDSQYTAAYVQVNVDTLDGKLIGDFGVRYVKTEVDVLGYTGDDGFFDACENLPTYDSDACLLEYEAVADDNSYVNILPTANFTYLLTDDLLIRAAAGQAMSRPNDNALKTTYRVRANNASDATVFTGNTDLKPNLASQLDLGIEWYFDKGAILSANFYYKNIADFIYKRVTRVDDVLFYADGVTPYPHPDSNEEDFDEDYGMFVINPYFLDETINGDEAIVSGVELAYTQRYTFLPGNWSGLGVNMNYTLASSEAVYEGIDENDENFSVEYSTVGQSEHTVNASVFYEMNGHSARISYNYRSDSLSQAITGERDSLWNEDYTQVDFSGRYKLSEHINIGLDVTNLFDVGQYQYSLAHEDGSPLENDVNKTRLGSYQFNGRTVRLTIDARF